MADDDTKADIIYTDEDEEPQPNPSPIDNQAHSDDDYQKIEREPEPSFYRAQTSIQHSSTPNPPNINSAKMEQLMLRFKELEQEINRKDEENQKLVLATETLKLEHERDLLELQMEVDRFENESTQYQLRYNEIHDELNELRQSQMEAASTGKEAQDLAIRFNQLEQDHTALMIDFEQSNRANSTLKQQLKNSQQNLSKLQNTMLKLKKDNTQLEKNLQTSMDKYDILQQQSKSEIHGMGERLDQLQQENEIYRRQLSDVEQEKQQMQEEFTEATMELLTDELNESHGDHKKESTALKLARIDTGDFNRTYDNDDTPEPSTPEFRAAAINNRFASQTSLPDQSLLDTLVEDDEYGHHHSRHSSMGSQMGYGMDPTRLKQDIREILHSDIKTLISQELMTASTKSHARLPSAHDGGANGIGNEDVEQLLIKVDELLAMSKRKSVDLSQSEAKQEAKLDQETLNNMMVEFKESMNEILQKGVIENIISSKDDRVQFQEAMNEKLQELSTKMGNNGGDERLNEMMKEAIQKQMTTMQIALENQIGNTVSDTVEDAIDKKINEALRNNIKQDMNVEMEQIKELIMNGMENMEQKDDGTSKLDGNQMEEILNNKLEDCMNNIMNGKIDGFMDSFRKEVVPEVQAVFEQLSLVKRSGSYEEADDEKQSNTNNSELLLANNKLKQEIEFLKEEKKGFDSKLQEAATSKVHQVVKLQNLLDHMREDNRVMAFQLNKYKEKFVEIREAQEQTPVNKLSNWWYSRSGNYIST